MSPTAIPITMVKARKGSQRGKTKLTQGGKRRARRHAHSHVQKGRIAPSQVRAPDVVRECWNVALTREQNLAAMGLSTNVNANMKGPKRQLVQGLMELAQMGEAKAPPRAAPGEISFVKKAVAKHGYDYKRIARDLDINYFQWNVPQIKRKVRVVALLGHVDAPPADDDE